MTARPASFDARVEAYMPMLKKLSTKLAPPAAREDLVQETIARVLERWQNFREDGGFVRWLYWQMRDVASSDNRRKRPLHADPSELNEVSVPANQESATDLSAAWARLGTTEAGRSLQKYVSGYSQTEIAEEEGVTPSAVSLRVAEARRALKGGVNRRPYVRTKKREVFRKAA